MFFFDLAQKYGRNSHYSTRAGPDAFVLLAVGYKLCNLFACHHKKKMFFAKVTLKFQDSMTGVTGGLPLSSSPWIRIIVPFGVRSSTLIIFGACEFFLENPPSGLRRKCRHRNEVASGSQLEELARRRCGRCLLLCIMSLALKEPPFWNAQLR